MMKRVKGIISLLLFVLISQASFGQACPGCVLDLGCPANLPDGGICQDTMPNGMAGHYYDQDVSFYMPYSFTDPGTGYNIQLNSITITGMSGLPVGVDWTSDSPTNQYTPQSTDLGCIKFCGTPLAPGVYDVEVFILANATATNTPIGSVTVDQAENYETQIRVLPDTAGGVSSFSHGGGPTSSCDVLDLDFSALVDGAPNPTTWEWTDVQGNTYWGPDPGSATLAFPGVYPVTLTTKIYKYVMTSFTIANTNTNWAGDIEEWTTLGFSPDLYFTIPSLGVNYRGNGGSNSTSASWNNINHEIPLGLTTVDIEVWDEDTGPPQGTNPLGSGDDNLGTHTLTLQLGTSNWSGNGNSGTVTFDTFASTVITETLDLTIFAPPPTPPLQVTSDSICADETAVVYVVGDASNFGLQWFEDTTLIPAAVDTYYNVSSTGDYALQIADLSTGCMSMTQPSHIEVFKIPPANISVVQAGNQLVNSNFPANGFGIQWYLNSVPIPGGNSQFQDIIASGDYYAEVWNLDRPECSNTSAIFSAVASGIEDLSSFGIQGLGVNPNPSSGNPTLQFSAEKDQYTYVTVLNSLGQIVWDTEFQAVAGVNQRQLNIDEPSGLYQVVIRIEDASQIVNIRVDRGH